MASYFPSFKGIPAVFDEIELGLFHDNVVHAERLRPRIRNGLTWLKLRKYLARVLEAFRFCTVASERERQLFAENFPEHATKVRLIPNCIAIKDYQGLEAKRTHSQLIFPGSFRYYSNYEAMKWFTGDVFPKILKRIPETCLLITGDHGGLPLSPVPNVTLTGEVQDIKTLIASSWISVAPLLSGGGTRLKILEAMALGTPVVSTSKGMEGLAAVPGEHLLLADSAQVFAEHVITLLQDTNLHDRLSANGRELVKEKYDWEAAMPRFLELVENAAR
jgi:glycosyltransferase involved in cell wall biosynthesis